MITSSQPPASLWSLWALEDPFHYYPTVYTCLPSSIFLSGFPTKALYMFLFCIHFVLHDLITLIIHTEEYKAWSSLRQRFLPALWYIIPLCHKCFPHQPVLEHFLCSFLKLRDQFSHPYKTTGKVTILYISIVIFLVSKLEDETF
jgi:hypothetical protein